MNNPETPHAGPSRPLVNDVADWLMTEALGSTRADTLLEQCALRLNAAGIPLWRANIAFRILHPLYQGVSHIWYRETGLEPIQTFAETGADSNEDWKRSPGFYVVEHELPFLRRRLTGPDAQLDFPLLEEFRDKGATDYLVWTISFTDSNFDESHKDGMIGSWATDRPGGFSDADIQALLRIQQRLAVACKMTIRDQITHNVLGAYLGPDAGERVLKGQIKLGDGETTHAVIWFSDLRESTKFADTMEPADFLHLVNSYFACTAGAVVANKGQVLRFVGDAVLGIFPIRDDGLSEQEACAHALNAAAEAERRLATLNKERRADGKPPLEFGLGLHLGDVMYGNIGIPERIEFSVIGPAANETARLENLSKAVGHRVLLSDRFAAALDRGFLSLGRHQLRGVDGTMEVFTLDTSADRQDAAE